MITIVNAQIVENNSITINIPTQRVIAITGNEKASLSLIYDILVKESTYRYSYLLGVDQAKYITDNVNEKIQFIAGLLPVAQLNSFEDELNLAIKDDVRGILYVARNPKHSETTLHAKILDRLYQLRANGNTIIYYTQNPIFLKNAEHIISINDDHAIEFQGDAKEYLNVVGPDFKKEIEHATSVELNKEHVFDLYRPFNFEIKNTKKTQKFNVLFNQITSIVVYDKSSSDLITKRLSELCFLSSKNMHKMQSICNIPKNVFKVSGLMTMVLIDNSLVRNSLKTIGEISQINELLSSLLKLIIRNNLFKLSTDQIKQVSVINLLQEFRKQVVVHQSFSSDEDLQRKAQILAGAIINRLDILDKLGFGNYNLETQSDKLHSGEILRLKLSVAIAQDMSGLCYFLLYPTQNMNSENLDNLFFMLYELKRMGNTVIAIENNQGFIDYSDHKIFMH